MILHGIVRNHKRKDSLFLHNGECSDLEETIKDIERVFLFFANKGVE